jgi:alpha-N-arabinofuranosidase
LLIGSPVVAVWSGLALDGNFIAEADLEPYIQSALDEIEFLTGDVHTKWGAVRASLGHPKPWTVKYVEIGNEDWLAGRPTAYDSYKKYRFRRFFDAFQKKYPKIQLIASPSVFDDMVIPVPAAGDTHPYLTPDGFINAFGMFDHLTKDNLTLIGEYAAVHPNGGIDWSGDLQPWPWWGGAVSEAIFLIGAERNSDRVIGATYVSCQALTLMHLPLLLTSYFAGPRHEEPEQVAMVDHDDATCRRSRSDD